MNNPLPKANPAQHARPGRGMRLLRGRAIDLSSALTESFQRLTAPKQPSILEGEMAAGMGAEVSFENGVPTVTSTAASQKPEKKIRAGSSV